MTDNFYPLSGRLLIPLTTLPTVPYLVTLKPQAKILQRIEITIPQAGVLQNLGVRIRSGDYLLYPAMGSFSDSNFTGGRDTFGAMPTTGEKLCLLFNRPLQGPPYDVTFEFYNDGAGTVAVNLLVIVSHPQVARMDVTPLKQEKLEGTIEKTIEKIVK